MAPVKAIIFDFGGVLCFPPTAGQIEQAAEIVGVSAPAFDRAFWANRLEYDAGRIAPADYWREVVELAGSPLSDAAAALGHLDVDFWSRLDGRVLAWARLLRERGYAIGMLSNLPRPLGEALRTWPGFLEHFDHLTFSYELGLVKPQREIYEHALGGLGVNGGEALFLDDRPRNIQGAVEAGLEALLYPNWEQFWSGRPVACYGLPELPDTFDAGSMDLGADACRQ